MIYFLLVRSRWNTLLLIGLILSCITLAEYSAIISDKLLHYIQQKYGTSAEKRVVKWQDIMRNNKNDSDWGKLNMVNNFFNKIPYETDLDHWKKYDYWATPIEMIATNGGDCEDYAIGKYFTLRELGIPIEKLRISYVIELTVNQPHMVLAYYETPDSDPLILDNIKGRITPASGREDLQPVYSFNGDGLWTAQERGNELKQDVGNVFSWQDLNERMVTEMNNASNWNTAAGSN